MVCMSGTVTHGRWHETSQVNILEAAGRGTHYIRALEDPLFYPTVLGSDTHFFPVFPSY